MRHPPLLRCLLALPLLAALRLPADDVDVRSFGAVGDGKTLDSAAVNRAIAAAHDTGGGTVRFRAGNYLCYSIRLQSNVALFLDSGAIVVAAAPSEDGRTGYDPAEPNPWDQYQDFGHNHWHNSLIWGENLQDIAITGPGRIYGYGLSRGTSHARRDLLPEERKAGVKLPDAPNSPEPGSVTPGPFSYPNARDTLPPLVGNKAIALKNCRNVIFRDFTIYHGGHFAILATAVDNWTCDGLKIDTNRDGIDFDCCRNVRVSNCTVNSPYDDGLCLKSSFGLGRRVPSENITLVNCQVSGYDEGTLLDDTRQRNLRGATGRIKLGTEANGGFRNIAIANCLFDHSCGLALEEVDGGPMEDIAISNLTMRDILDTPIFIRLGARLRGPSPIAVEPARHIRIENVVASDVSANHGILIAGLPGRPIEDVSLSGILIVYRGGGTKEQAGREVPELESGYPEAGRFGRMPSYGLFARHVAGLSLDHVELRYMGEEHRPAIFLADASAVDLDRVKAEHPAAPAPTMVLRDVRGLSIRDCGALADGSWKTIEAESR